MGSLYGWPITQSMSGLSLALKWHLRAPQTHALVGARMVLCYREVVWGVVCYEFLHS